MSKGSLREQMPTVTGFIDALREAFGKDMIDRQIRLGMKGEPAFWATENGHEIGTRVDLGTRCEVTWDPVTGRAVAREKSWKEEGRHEPEDESRQ